MQFRTRYIHIRINCRKYVKTQFQCNKISRQFRLWSMSRFCTHTHTHHLLEASENPIQRKDEKKKENKNRKEDQNWFLFY